MALRLDQYFGPTGADDDRERSCVGPRMAALHTPRANMTHRTFYRRTPAQPEQERRGQQRHSCG